MKRILLLFVVGLLFRGISVAREGVVFRDISLEEALKQAKAENKLVFVDCYTPWCGQCYKMMKEVFPKKEAGDYFNSRFVCVKYDMTKDENIGLAKRFRVGAYPTFILIRPDGTVLHKRAGGGDLDFLIPCVEEGLNDSTNLWGLEQEYARGGMGNVRLMAYQAALADACDNDKAAGIYRELWGRLSDKERVQKEFWRLYTDDYCTFDSPMCAFMLSHLDEIRANTGREEVDRFLSVRYGKILEKWIKGLEIRDSISFGDLCAQVKGLHLPQLDEMRVLAGWVVEQEVQALTDWIAGKMPEVNSQAVRFYADAFQGISWGHDFEVPDNYDACGTRLAGLTVDKMERQGTKLAAKDLENYFGALSCFRRELPVEWCRRLVALGDKVLPVLPDDEQLSGVKRTFDGIRRVVEQENK